MARKQIQPRAKSGTNIDLAGLFANIGGGSVEPVEPGDVPYTDPTFDARTQVRFKPQHPVLNFLSGGRGTAAANQLNTEQIVGASETAQETAALKERAANLSAIALKQHATEKFINTTGVLPEDRPDLYTNYVKDYSAKLMGLGEAETQAKTEAEKTKGIEARQEGQIAESTFPFRQSALNLDALKQKYLANAGVTEARGTFGRQPFVEQGKDVGLQQQLANQHYLNLLGQVEAGTKVFPHGAYNVLGQKFTPFPQNIEEQMLMQNPAFKSQLGIQDKVGRIVDFDPQLGRAIVEKTNPASGIQQQTAPSGVTVKPINNILPTETQSSPLNLPKGQIAGAIGTGLVGQNAADFYNKLRAWIKSKNIQIGGNNPPSLKQYDPLLDETF